MGIAVYIATTAGPVRIERIVGETVPQSNVFVGRGYKPLEPVSADYEAFVAPGGPVETAFAPFETPSFRLDVSGPIDTGNSWELAIFIAHGLAKAGRLAAPDDVAEAAVVLTGRVDADLNVGAVGHIDEKLRATAELIADCEARECPITFFYPAGDSVTHSSDADLAKHPVGGAMEVMAYLDDASGQRTPTTPPSVIMKERDVKVGSRPSLFLLIFIFVAGGVGYAMVGGREVDGDGGREPSKEITKPVIGSKSPKIEIFERRPPAGKNCIDVQFGDISAHEVRVDANVDGQISSSQLTDICGLRVLVAAADPQFKGVAILRVLSGRYLGQSEIERRTNFDGRTEWVLDLARRMDTAFQFSVSASVRSGEGAVTQLTHQVLQ